MVSHTQFQSYKINFFTQCMTGCLGCRWHRYQQSRRPNRKRDIFWFVVLCFTFLYVSFFFYFWLVTGNNFDDFNWFIYTRLDVWYPWYTIIVGLVSTAFVYYLILMLLCLCHIIQRHQLLIHPVHLAITVITLVACISFTVVLDDMWNTSWAILFLSFQMTGPFLYIGAVAIVTLLSMVVASEWVYLQSIASRLICLFVYLTVICCLYATPAFIHSPCIIDIDDLPPKPKVIAHRGASGVAPESTKISFEYAITYGAYILESDVRISKDGVPFLLHDSSLDRTTNAKDIYPDLYQNASSLTFTQLQKLDAGSWFIDNNPMSSQITADDRETFKQQRIMSLAEYLQLAKEHNIAVMFDVFAPPTENQYRDNITDVVFDVIRESGIHSELVWWLVSNLTYASQIHDEYNFTIVTGHMYDEKDLSEHGISHINIEAHSQSQQIIQQYHASNISVNIYPVNTRWLFSLYWCMGADSVASDMIHLFQDMRSPVWTMKRESFVIMWIAVACVSMLVIALSFIVQYFRLSDDNPEAVSLQNVTRTTQNYTETTFQSPVTMKLRLLPSLESLDNDSTNVSYDNRHVTPLALRKDDILSVETTQVRDRDAGRVVSDVVVDIKLNNYDNIDLKGPETLK